MNDSPQDPIVAQLGLPNFVFNSLHRLIYMLEYINRHHTTNLTTRKDIS